MNDAEALRGKLNDRSVQLLMTDADTALTFIQVAESTRLPERVKHATQDARKAYETICAKRGQFTFSQQDAVVLEIKLQEIGKRLTELENVR